MKKIQGDKLIIGLMILLYISIFSISIYAEEFYLEDTEDTTIRIGGDNYFPPFEYVDDNGVYRGFNVDIMRAIAIEMGLEIEIIPMPWYQAIIELQRGNIDVIQGMKFSESRDYTFDFSEPYLVSSQAIFVSSNNKYIVDIEDLSNKKVAIQKNDISMDLLKDKDNVEIIETENQEIAIQKLLNGEVDAYIGNRLTGLYIIQKNGVSKNLKIVGEEINPQDYCVAVREGNEDLVEIFNEGLNLIRKNGTYDKVYKKWFGEPIETSNEFIKRVLYMSFGVLILLLFIIYMFYRWNHILKNEVSKRTEELKREAVFKEQTLNSIFSGLITFNNFGVILSANKKATHFLKVSQEELVGKHYRETDVKSYFHEDYFEDVLERGIEKLNIEKTIDVQGKNVVLEYNLYPLVISKDNIDGITLTFKDITHEKIMKEKIIMKDKLESLGRLIAGIAHEIRNPLTSIKTYIELIPKKYENPEFRQKISEDVPREIERLNSIISSLLDYSRPSIPNKEPVDVKKTVKEIVAFFCNHLKEKDISLELDLDDDLYIFVDKQQFTQIMINFLLNSVEAMDNIDNPRILITNKVDNSKAYIIIVDNGCGIPQENISMIFEPFFTTKTKGTGLGLSISYQFIKENGGEINIQSTLDKGTRIEIVFPLSEKGVEKVD